MKLLTKIQAAALLCATSCPALADGVDYQTISDAASKTGDLSRQALVMIFGDVVLTPFQPGQATLIGSLFALLNGVLCTVALVWFLIVTLKTLFKGGQDGKVFSAGRTWLHPVMSFAGFITLIPTSSGWSLSQLVMLWAASTMGIGSANLFTDKAADMISSGMSLVVQPTAPSTRSAARAVFEMNLCKYATNRELSSLYQDGQARTALMETKGGNGDYTTGNGSAICGSAHIPEPSPGVMDSLFGSAVNTASVTTAERGALDTMQSTLDAAALAYVDGYLSRRDQDSGTLIDPETTIQNAAAAYETTVNNALNQLNYKDSLQSQLTTQLKTNGWISLGAWYNTFATANSKTNEVANAAPVTSGSSLHGETGTGDLYHQVFTAYRSQIQNSTYTAPLGSQTAKDDGAALNATDPDAVFVSFYKSPMQKITNAIATNEIGTDADFSHQVNPLIKMQTIGDYTLSATETALAAYTLTLAAASTADNSVLGKVGGLLFVNPGAVVKDVLTELSPPFYFVMLLLFAVGFSLAVFLPAVPFLYWMVGVFNWLVSVMVGCAAGPMWSATHLGAEEDKGSRSAYGYIFLIDMMLRPSLMVLGFFFASVAVMAGGTLLNLLFGTALANANADSIIGLVKMVGWLLIYARIATFGVTRVFGLQATLADYVITFLGGSGMAGIMGGLVDDVKGMFAAAGGGSRRVPGLQKVPNSGSTKEDGIQ
ncbi:conjugal transfer/type IV secretion protein DotA/TraY [Kosakonia radicincitans]|uniref:Conjugal transfer/type IV secretion protein DotA/TraY n=1 Tax=Kosakonia radicincitans TaxID=283686 RepID=A0AAX2EZH1_9ENTR|nr:DotA/TraY family protein [Kosakonia radicincitans]SFF38287.1 conjugal transfer/type IV secretion protein DotA/TraY [Kosakonia radicincitans]SFR26284.1 conjugal transfer/type IV secretion protein DotA/TraY [Kosakonia radicincitans]SFU16780.1 conjugal transfer/type IV secretion protein DotA/TraY [Kosakonia radicincitans]SFY32175.1 conjugal transfer/type IV secretion protein DotA/TraY [Kosakonia radicincitans]